MSLQQAIDIIHTIREQFPHIAPYLTQMDNGCFIIGVYQGTIRTYKRHAVLSSAWEWTYFLKLFAIFSNL